MRTSEKNIDIVVDDAQNAATPETANPSADAKPSEEMQVLVSEEELNRLKEERDQLFDRLARAQAEFENTRKREIRDRADFRETTVARTVEQFLPVLDNFQLALGSSGSIEQLRAGVELIVKQMEEILRSLQVQRIETVGTQFDPRIHEAIESAKRTDLPDKQVLEEVRRGYRIQDRLLRPALVRVVDNSQKTEA